MTDEDRRRNIYFMSEKLMKPEEAAKAANVNYDTARKWKQIYDRDPEKNIPLKTTNRTLNRPVSQLNENHKKHLISFFDENPSAFFNKSVQQGSIGAIITINFLSTQ
jgi:transposase